MIVPIVAVCAIGLVATVFNIVERNKLQTVRITINGVSHIIAAPDRHADKTAYYTNWSIDYCSREGPKYGFDVTNFGQCTAPLLELLLQKPVLGKKERTLQLELHPTNHAELGPDTKSAASISSASVSETIPTVDESLIVEQPAVVNPLLHKIPLEINNITYIFEYAVSAVPEERHATASQLASAFCSAHGESLIDKNVLDRAVDAQEGEPNEAVALRRQEVLERLLRDECSKPIAGALAANMLYPDQL